MKGEYQNRKLEGGAKRTSTSKPRGTKLRFLKNPIAYKMAYEAGQIATVFDKKKADKMIKDGTAEKC